MDLTTRDGGPVIEETTAVTIDCVHMNHINAVVEHFDESVEHFCDLYGAQFVMDLPMGEPDKQRDGFHACLLVIAGVLFELFVPHEYLLNARSGPHYIGLEYQTDVEAARKAVEERDIRIIRDLGHTFHTHPDDTFGVALEYYGGTFHEGPNLDPNKGWREQPKPIEYWRNEHPIGYTGLKHYSIAVSDIDAATKFFQAFTGATIAYEAPRPAVAARAIGLTLADTVAELITPVHDGPLQRFLDRYGDGIRSTVFAVRNIEQVQRYFAEQGVTLHPGDAPESLAIAPQDNQGIIFEFSE